MRETARLAALAAMEAQAERLSRGAAGPRPAAGGAEAPAPLPGAPPGTPEEEFGSLGRAPQGPAMRATPLVRAEDDDRRALTDMAVWGRLLPPQLTDAEWAHYLTLAERLGEVGTGTALAVADTLTGTLGHRFMNQLLPGSRPAGPAVAGATDLTRVAQRLGTLGVRLLVAYQVEGQGHNSQGTSLLRWPVRSDVNGVPEPGIVALEDAAVAEIERLVQANELDQPTDAHQAARPFRRREQLLDQFQGTDRIETMRRLMPIVPPTPLGARLVATWSRRVPQDMRLEMWREVLSRNLQEAWDMAKTKEIFVQLTPDDLGALQGGLRAEAEQQLAAMARYRTEERGRVALRPTGADDGRGHGPDAGERGRTR